MSSLISRQQIETRDQLLTLITDLCSQHGPLEISTRTTDLGSELGIRIANHSPVPWVGWFKVPTSSSPNTPSSNSSGLSAKELIQANFASTTRCLVNLSDSGTAEEIKTLTRFVSDMASRLKALSSRVSSKEESVQAISRLVGSLNMGVATLGIPRKYFSLKEKNWEEWAS